MQEATNYTIAKESWKTNSSCAGSIWDLRLPSRMIKACTNTRSHQVTPMKYRSFRTTGQPWFCHRTTSGYVGWRSSRVTRRSTKFFLIGSEMVAAFGEEKLESSKMVSILQEWL